MGVSFEPPMEGVVSEPEVTWETEVLLNTSRHKYLHGHYFEPRMEGAGFELENLR